MAVLVVADLVGLVELLDLQEIREDLEELLLRIQITLHHYSGKQFHLRNRLL
jgi:hypothetical protein